MNSSTKTIMQILPALNSGGVERGVIDVAKATQKAGFKSIVLSNGGSMVSQLFNSQVKHICLPLVSKNPFTIYSNIGRIVQIIEENQVDLIHIRSRAPAWSAYFAWKRLQKTGNKCQMISSVHGSYSLNLLSDKISQLKLKYNSVMLKPQFIIVVSNFIRKYVEKNYSHLENLKNKEIRLVHRGVDVDYFSASKVSKPRITDLISKWNLPDDKKIIMLPARITAWKGHEFLISALAKVQNPNFFCIMVGGVFGHEQFVAKIEQQIKDNNLQGKVKLVGETKDMPAAYLVSDVVISSSIRPEAFGRVAIEAGSMGRVIIATNIGGSLETVIDGKTGFLVEVGDAEGLAKKIDQVLTMEETKKSQMQEDAIKHITENFSNQKMLQKTIEFYQQILSK
jgi:glycosyltransferase involved in cell wall biosynthesis